MSKLVPPRGGSTVISLRFLHPEEEWMNIYIFPAKVTDHLLLNAIFIPCGDVYLEEGRSDGETDTRFH